jgi:uncharacterized membrane protein SpoIIM required for sporulation
MYVSMYAFVVLLMSGSWTLTYVDILIMLIYRGPDKSLARLTSRCILFDGENISFDANLFIYVNSTNIPPIVMINRLYEHQDILLL